MWQRGGPRSCIAATVVFLCLACGCGDEEPDPEISTGPPSRFDWRECAGALPEVGDQGLSPSCVAWAVGYGSATFRLKKYLHSEWDLDEPEHRISPAYLYNLAVQHSVGCDIGDTVDDETEAPTLQFVTVMSLLFDLGASTEKSTPYTVSHSRIPTQGAMDEAETLRAELACVSEWSNLSGWSYENWRAIKEKIVDSGPVLFMIEIYDDLACGVGADYVPEDNHAYKGKHAILCVGYDDNHKRPGESAAVPSFVLMNSWGKSWASGGFIWIPYEVLVPSNGDPAMLLQVFAAGPPTRTPSDAPPPSLCFPEEWAQNPAEESWAAEAYDHCGQIPAQFLLESQEDLRLSAGQSRIKLRGPRIPLVPTLLRANARFTSQASDTFTLSPSEPDRKAVGAWVEVAELVVHDRDAAPNPIVVNVGVDVREGNEVARKTIRVFVR